jgi:hypothetical protein
MRLGARSGERGETLRRVRFPQCKVHHSGPCEPNAISNAIGYAEHYSRSHNALVRVYDAASNMIETHEPANLPQGPLVTRTETGAEAIPFATTSSSLGPVSWVDGTSKWVDTSALEATAMLLWS